MNGRAALLGIVLGVAVVLAGCRGDDAEPSPTVVNVVSSYADHDYVIPRGTADRIASGEKVIILPKELRARVGQVIRIENRDTRGHMLGPFYVGAGETLTQMFTSPGTYTGTCTIDPSGEMTLVVSP
ncbi:MAG TPA: hypothetical protein VF183_01075 [Acidimicrobiales bacterium]